MKLKEKIRVGAKIHRRYYLAKTPYQYLMESDQISVSKRSAEITPLKRLIPYLVLNYITEQESVRCHA
ncbi:MAG: hypothetical protein QME57_04760 [Patescibacteria group bacterium]|nr:hypothetical protein [Patescibacteria group bacterium]